MYHSISAGSEPIAIAPPVFRRQMEILAECGCHGVSLRDYRRWRLGEVDLAEGFVVLTFDDGYEDFATVAFPEISKRGWGCTLFLPTDWIREADAGVGGDGGPTSRFLSWPAVADLARAGVELGGHGVTHADLTTLAGPDARREIVESKRAIEERTAAPVSAFAPPYGRSSRALRQEIAQHYACAVGTHLRLTRPGSPVFDLPRIEMWYFRDPRRWRHYLRSGPTAYFAARKLLRSARTLLMGRKR
jgi:peptidoglycan/xylan/chitin deacetylase (PgdA/CDA1 family)